MENTKCSRRQTIEDQIRMLQNELSQLTLVPPREGPRQPIRCFSMPFQSGKTNKAIIEPTIRAISEGTIPIILLPNRIAIQLQTSGRLTQWDTIRNLADNIRPYASQIGRFDTGTPLRNRLRSAEDAVTKVRQGAVRILVVLGNKLGTSLLCGFLHLAMRQLPEKKFHIIVDEVHSVLVFNSNAARRLPGICRMLETSQDPVSVFRMGNTQTNIAWLLQTYRDNPAIDISATTATISNIVRCKELRNLAIRTEIGTPPECYVGYEDLKKETYATGFVEDAFGKIVSREGRVVVMCHSGKYVRDHNTIGETFLAICTRRRPGAKVGYLTDNSRGYLVHDADGYRKYAKTSVSEPWEIVAGMQNDYDVIGIFGDTCMSQSNTYQKPDRGVVLTDLVVLPIPPHRSANKLSTELQKIGRICCNDALRRVRTLWFPDDEVTQGKIEHALRYESALQEATVTTSYGDVNHRRILRDTRGDGVVSHGNGDMESKFMAWSEKNNDTKISSFMKRLDPTKKYTKVEIYALLKSCGFSNESRTLQNIMKSGPDEYGDILNCTNNKYFLKEEYIKLHNKYFNK